MPSRTPRLGFDDEERVHTWPYLLRIELVVSLVCMTVLLVWSILIDAPLEQMADPTRTPNPSKAPWYFLGLQEMLVYFDPWIAGVALPGLIIFGLCAIPFLDVNPEGSGYYCWRSRRVALSVFWFGLGLWLVLILVGTFFRGPGWGWFWPWEPWDPHAVATSARRSWSALFGLEGEAASFIFGGATLMAYYGLGLAAWLWLRRKRAVARMGWARFACAAFLGLTMLGLPIKIGLRLGLGVQYVWETPWFNI